jgi:hypothetical protein
MAKIVASYLLKVHVHEAEPASPEAAAELEAHPTPAPTNDEVKAAVIAGLEKEVGGPVTVSLIERTDD